MFAAVVLRRIDHARDFALFHSLDVGRDLLSRVVPEKQWRWIVTAGRTRLEEHPGEGTAMSAELLDHPVDEMAGLRLLAVSPGRVTG